LMNSHVVQDAEPEISPQRRRELEECKYLVNTQASNGCSLSWERPRNFGSRISDLC
jgi:hypothetical protein